MRHGDVLDCGLLGTLLGWSMLYDDVLDCGLLGTLLGSPDDWSVACSQLVSPDGS